jgi:predicted methyltransferase
MKTGIRSTISGWLTAAGLLLGACVQLNPVASDDMARGATSAGTVSSSQSIRPPSAAAIERAVSNPRRLPADRERDERRKAGAVLAFFSIEPGMTVLDLFSGGGYYTELLSYLVGEDGRVVAHNNSPYLRFAGKEVSERYKPGRLLNVERVTAENNQLVLPSNTFDAVMMILSYHDVYFVDANRGWTRIDGPALLAEIYDAMKPGAVLGVIDHAAAPGSPPETGGTLHRIDPAIIKKDFAAAGFVLEAESDLLRNATDDRSLTVFDPRVNGRTDRVMLRFRRP